MYTPRLLANERAGPPSQARSRSWRTVHSPAIRDAGSARSGVYRKPQSANDNDLDAVRRIDAQFQWSDIGEKRLAAFHGMGWGSIIQAGKGAAA